jgi:hypothetical protein
MIVVSVAGKNDGSSIEFIPQPGGELWLGGPTPKCWEFEYPCQRVLYHDGESWIVRINDCNSAMAILNDGVDDRPFFGAELEGRCVVQDDCWELRLEKTLILRLSHHTIHFSLIRPHTEGPTRLILRHDEPPSCMPPA